MTLSRKPSPINQWLPPRLVQWFVRSVWRVGYFGNYPNWDAARRVSDGYDDPRILKQVTASALRAKDGQGIYERDGVLFDQIEQPWPVLAAILGAAVTSNEWLHVLDVGGGLGTSYQQCRSFLEPVGNLQWSIVEQESFVATGRNQFQTTTLQFYSDVDACLTERPADVLLLSSVLPYVPAPHELLQTMVRLPFRMIIIDRTPMWSCPEDRLTVQRVPTRIYGTRIQYPAWVFSQEGLAKHFDTHFMLVTSFDAIGSNTRLGQVVVRDRGMVFKRRATSDHAPSPA